MCWAVCVCIRFDILYAIIFIDIEMGKKKIQHVQQHIFTLEY